MRPGVGVRVFGWLAGVSASGKFSPGKPNPVSGGGLFLFPKCTKRRPRHRTETRAWTTHQYTQSSEGVTRGVYAYNTARDVETDWRGARTTKSHAVTTNDFRPHLTNNLWLGIGETKGIFESASRVLRILLPNVCVRRPFARGSLAW